MKIVRYRSAVGLVAAVTVLMVIDASLGMVAVWSDWLEIQMLEEAELAAAVAEDEVEANDLRQAAIGFVQLAVMVVLYVAFLMWVYRANKNARALGATDMTYGPGWSVGYFFIPILNLFRPYQAMKEIWRGSHPDFHDDWRQAPSSPILPLWWTLWIVSNIVGQIVFRLSLRADTLPQLLAAAKFDIALELISLPLGFVAWLLVYTIHGMQETKVARLHGDPDNVYHGEAMNGWRDGEEDSAAHS